MEAIIQLWVLFSHHLDALLHATWLTLWLSGLAMILGLALAIISAALQQTHIPVFRRSVKVYVESIRNTPFLVQLFIVYFGLPAFGLRLDANRAALLALSINAGAYCTEIIRAGIESVNRGQVETGFALGLRRSQVFFLIVLPQALRAVYPSLTSQFMLIMLDTSVASAISTNELAGTAANISSATFQTADIYIIVTLIYLVLSFFFSFLFKIVSVCCLETKAA